MKPRVYLETTIISYLVARPSRDLVMAAYQQITQDWWQLHRNNFELFISELVMTEASAGDKQAAKNRLQLLKTLDLLVLNEEAVILAQEFVKKNVIPVNVVEDALHIALATVQGMDYLLTWNFKHLANGVTRHKIEQLCRLAGYEPPIICSPQELLEE